MTISANSNFELSRDQLLRRACQLAGVLDAQGQPESNDLDLAVDLLGMELDALQAEGIVLRTAERASLPLLAGVVSYTLDNDCIDCFIGPDNFLGTILQTTGTTETRVKAITRHEYQTNLLNKQATSNPPTHCYVEKQAVVKVLFWPIPSADCTFNYQKIRLVRDADTGAVTLDVSRRWQKAICYAIAWQVALAKSKPKEIVQLLMNVADNEKGKARGQDVEKAHGQFYVSRWQ